MWSCSPHRKYLSLHNVEFVLLVWKPTLNSNLITLIVLNINLFPLQSRHLKTCCWAQWLCMMSSVPLEKAFGCWGWVAWIWLLLFLCDLVCFALAYALLYYFCFFLELYVYWLDFIWIYSETKQERRKSRIMYLNQYSLALQIQSFNFK